MVGTVVLIEDEQSIGTLVRAYLERDGFQAVWVRSGEQGLAELDRHPVRLVILDVGLPGMDGYAVASRLRQALGVDGIFLIALTGYAQPEDRRRAFDSGFDAHLAKPINYSSLSSLLSQGHVRREAAADAPDPQPNTAG